MELRRKVVSPSSLSDLQTETDGFSRPLLSQDAQAGPVYQAAGLTLLVSSALDAGEGLVVDPSRFPTTLLRSPMLEVDSSAKLKSDQVAL